MDLVTRPPRISEIKVKFNAKEEYGRLSPVGHGTRVYNVESVEMPRSLTSDSDIVSSTRSLVNKYQPDLIENLRVVYYSYDYEGSETSRIRESVGLPIKIVNEMVAGRVLRDHLIERLQNMMTLRPRLFMSAWLQIVKCHYFIWECGVQHSDISEGNVMYRSKGNGIYGVLNDWDLATIRDRKDHGGLERTGSMPFMSLHLLTEEYWNGAIKRLYRHELESLIWLLPWVALNYSSGKYRLNNKVKYWITGNYTLCREDKGDFLSFLCEFCTEGLWQDMRPIIGKPLSWLVRFRANHNLTLVDNPGGWIEPDNQSLYHEIMDMVVAVMARFPDISVPAPREDIPVDYRRPPTPPLLAMISLPGLWRVAGGLSKPQTYLMRIHVTIRKQMTPDPPLNRDPLVCPDVCTLREDQGCRLLH
ncbi:unnamed protein product [Somion occarium]|uniref:Fungal-type protein kinase domain-containing protein n=1 Tax=Somion occarium TaxID=3059160 RepID=A0ABP1CYH3_9APHY